MNHVLGRRSLGLLRTAAAFVLFAGAVIAADTTPPQLVSLSVSPLSFDSSAGPVVLTVSITATDDAGGASIVAGSAGLILTHESGGPSFGGPNLSVVAGSSTTLVFQFSITIPQSSTPGVYRMTLRMVDAATNSVSLSSTDLQALGMPSSVTLTQAAFGPVTLSQSAANVTAAGGPGTLGVTTPSGSPWAAVSNATWLRPGSGCASQ